ncbi:MAG: cytochrome c maturation protein CcmE [Solirubrobacterales bacterium]|nr:cytochrome c maturation protein CcmE [Solirubrobacterales bacterium]
MDPARKRKTRLIVTLGIALLLSTALIYTSFSASTVARTPSQLLASSTPGESYQLTGKVVDGSVDKTDDLLVFRVRDRSAPKDAKSILVRYTGTVPDPFRQGREVVVTGKVVNGVMIAKPNSLITKCPSKFSNSDGSGATGSAKQY